MSRPKPDLRDPEYVAYAHLFNDITFAPRPGNPHFLFSQRQALTDHLWELGYRKPTPTADEGRAHDIDRWWVR